MQFRPFMDVVVERYGVYWPVAPKGSPEAKELAGRLNQWSRELDRVFVFPRATTEIASETDHGLKGDKVSTGIIPGTAYSYRQAEPGGWFSWTLKVDPGVPMELVCTYSGSDVNRTFDILVENEVVATQVLNQERPWHLIDRVTPVPKRLTQGKDRVVVTFKANHGTVAGAVYGCATLKAQ